MPVKFFPLPNFFTSIDPNNYDNYDPNTDPNIQALINDLHVFITQRLDLNKQLSGILSSRNSRVQGAEIIVKLHYGYNFNLKLRDQISYFINGYTVATYTIQTKVATK